MNEIGVPSRIQIDRATHALWNNRNANVGKKRNAIKNDEPIVSTRQQASEIKFTTRELRNTDDIPTKPTPATSENIIEHKLRELNDADLWEESTKRSKLNQIRTQKRYPGKAVSNKSSVQEDEREVR